MVLNLKMTDTKLNFLFLTSESPFWGDLGTFLYVNLHYVSIFQISVGSWHIRYQIEALHCGSSFMCSFGTFSGCHGNGSQ